MASRLVTSNGTRRKLLIQQGVSCAECTERLRWSKDKVPLFDIDHKKMFARSRENGHTNFKLSVFLITARRQVGRCANRLPTQSRGSTRLRTTLSLTFPWKRIKEVFRNSVQTL